MDGKGGDLWRPRELALRVLERQPTLFELFEFDAASSGLSKLMTLTPWNWAASDRLHVRHIVVVATQR